MVFFFVLIYTVFMIAMYIFMYKSVKRLTKTNKNKEPETDNKEKSSEAMIFLIEDKKPDGNAF